jgi:hypothetical protein
MIYWTPLEGQVMMAGRGGLFVDRRLIGRPRIYAVRQPDWDMRVPDELKRCVCYLGGREARNAKEEYVGTGFFVNVLQSGQVFSHLVTADHVLTRMEAFPYRLLRFNNRQGDAVEVDINGVKWFKHPSEPKSVDVAACNIPFRKDLEALDSAFGSGAFLTRNTLEGFGYGIGDEVFALGLLTFAHGKRANVPLLREGCLAMVPVDRVQSKTHGLIEAYVIDAHSIGGMSGSPVFIRQSAYFETNVDMPHPDGSGTYRMEDERLMASGRIALLGILHGYLDDHASFAVPFNVGLSLVVPGDKVIEVLHSSEMGEERERLLPEVKKINEELWDGWVEKFEAQEAARKEQWERDLEEWERDRAGN